MGGPGQPPKVHSPVRISNLMCVFFLLKPPLPSPYKGPATAPLREVTSGSPGLFSSLTTHGWALGVCWCLAPPPPALSWAPPTAAPWPPLPSLFDLWFAPAWLLPVFSTQATLGFPASVPEEPGVASKGQSLNWSATCPGCRPTAEQPANSADV